MDRRDVLSALALSPLLTETGSAAPDPANSFLEIKTWYLHNTGENQGTRVSAYLEKGLAPALARAGARLAGAFGNLVGPDGPYYISLSEYPSLAVMQDCIAKLRNDSEHTAALQQLSTGSGLPFVRVRSSLLRSFDAMPKVSQPADAEKQPGRIFELRTYESQTFTTLARKVGMFNGGEMQIFQRLGMRPVFFGETIVGDRQPNLMYMLTYDSWAARDQLWKAFVSDPAWKKLSSQPELKDTEIVENISNVLLHPLPFSPV